MTLDGATLSAKRVEVDAGSLSIASRQDTSTFASKDKSAGLNVSVTFTGQVSASGNLSSGKQSGDFASVETQAGIRAGDGGFGIRVAGATDLKGAVIASTADAARNQLTTGTLTASALENRETFKATSTSIGAGIGANLGKDRTGTINTDQSGNKLPGIKTGIGTLSATPPAALSASGSQASTTVSAIAQGGITVTSGDTASLGVTQTISRDTSAANDALTKQFTEAKRTEIDQGFEATRQLVSEVGTFFSNRGREEADLRKAADDAKARGDTAEETRLRDQADKLRSQFGAGSIARIGATALTGAAGSNVTGGLGSLVQGAAVNVLQSLAVTEVKKIADSFGRRDPFGNLIETPHSEAIRAALQALVGCAGSAAGGSNGCGSAAAGAAASVVFNNLLNAIDKPPVIGPDGREVPQSLEDQQARTNLVGTIIAAIASGAGLNANTATTAATIETENNRNVVSNGRTLIQTVDVPGTTEAQFLASVAAYRRAKPADYTRALALFGGNESELINYLRQPNGQSLDDAGAASVTRTAAAAAQSAAAPNRDEAIRVNLVAHLAAGRANYDAEYGPGAYDALIARGRAEDAAIEARVDAAQAQLTREFACIVGCIPAAVASVIFFPIAVGAAGEYAVASTGLAGVSALGVKAGIGGTASLLYTEASTQAIFGHAPSVGERIGSFTTGAIFAPGVYGVSQFTAPVNGAINGGLAGGGANLIGQRIDIRFGNRDGFSLPQFGASTAVGTIAGGIGGTVAPYYNYTPSLGNSRSIVAGARVGLRVQGNALPATTVTTVTQAQLDPVAAVVLCTRADPKDCPK